MLVIFVVRADNLTFCDEDKEKGEVKVVLACTIKENGEMETQNHSFVTSALNGVIGLTSRPQ